MAVRSNMKTVRKRVHSTRYSIKRIPASVEDLMTAEAQQTEQEFRSAPNTTQGVSSAEQVVVTRRKDTLAAEAMGSEVMFKEFGTGVRYPDRHPLASKVGAIRGGFGRHRGADAEGWRFSAPPGSGTAYSTEYGSGVFHTYGQPASMPMYNNFNRLVLRSPQAIKERFK